MKSMEPITAQQRTIRSSPCLASTSTGVAGPSPLRRQKLFGISHPKSTAPVSVWVPAAAKQYVENGVLKAACPECGAIIEMSDFSRVIAFVCDEYGAGVDVDPEIDSGA
jgi:hypothetical protein